MTAVIVSFFSPCEYELPKKHFAATVDWLVKSGAEVAVTQATLPGQEPQPVPESVAAHRVFENAGILWLKENLWNLGAELVPHADKLVFVDSDIFFHSKAWLSETEDLLDRVDVCQPFQTCYWLDRGGRPTLMKPSAAHFMEHGKAPWLGQCHVGFSWAMRRKTFEDLGGFYEYPRGGGGDAAFAMALARVGNVEALIRMHASARRLGANAPSFKKYRANAVRVAPSVGAVNGGRCFHRWHGERSDRQYTNREMFFPETEDGDSPVEKREDGLLQWTADAPLARTYFERRREDG